MSLSFTLSKTPSPKVIEKKHYIGHIKRLAEVQSLYRIGALSVLVSNSLGLTRLPSYRKAAGQGRASAVAFLASLWRRAWVPCGHSERWCHSFWGSCSGWGHPCTDTCWLFCLSQGHLPHLPACPVAQLAIWLQLDLPISPCVGFSQSLKKMKTPPLSKSEKPGKSPPAVGLTEAHMARSLGGFKDPSRDGPLPKEAAHFIPPSIHPSTQQILS